MNLSSWSISPWKKWGLGLVGISTFILCLSLELTPLPERLNESHSPMLLYNDGSVAHIHLAPDDRWRTMVNLSKIDPAYLDALLSIEDERFYWHTGFDPLSIVRALIQNTLSGEVVSGASTLTMQLIRIVEPRPRTYRSKIIETWRAVQLEWHYSKSDILAQYLSFIPFGRNIEGIEAASLAFFGQLPTHLEAHQIALLLAIPQNPNARYPHPKNQQRLRDSRNHIATLLHRNHKLPIEDDSELVQHVFNKPVPTRLHDFPRDLPHLMDQLIQHLSPSQQLQTTLDPHVQSTLVDILRERHSEYTHLGIHNTSVVIVDKHNGEIRGLIGNFDYWSGKHGSTIASYSTTRSAGSTLKPFLYAHAIDLGQATPSRIMEDIPQNFRGYQPRNYGSSYHGLVTLRESLTQSYNIPFIKLLSEIGLNAFLHHLSGLGIREFEETKDRLGLSAAVGLELTPLELTQAYTTLANLGHTTRIRLFEDETLEKHILPMQQLAKDPISEGGSWLAGEAMRQRDRPDFPDRMDYTMQQRPLSWKTGTSFGFHDAWTAGWGEEYVATVWFGNLDHTSSIHLIGSQAAGTVFFELMERLESSFVAPTKPSDLTTIDICEQTGLIPSASCTEIIQTLARKIRVPTEQCTQHHTIFLDTDGNRNSPQCTKTPLTQETVWVPSIEFQRWSKIPIALPPLSNSCIDGATLQSKLMVKSPKENHRILLLEDGQQQNIPLQANHNDPHAKLYWYIDDAFQGYSMDNEQLWWTPTAGTHTISVEDGHGNSDRITVQVDHFANITTP
jgi:penicillin-binding protein 1C